MARNTAQFRSGLVKNGNFENAPAFTAVQTTNSAWVDGSATGSQTNKTWKWYGEGLAATRTVQFDDSDKVTGTYSLKIVCSTTASAPMVQNTGGVTLAALQADAVLLKPNTSYTLSGWAKCPGNTLIGAHFRCVEYDSAATLKATNLTTYATNNANWIFVTKTFTTNASTLYGVIQCVLQISPGADAGTYTAWFDDVTLTQTARTSASVRTELYTNALINDANLLAYYRLETGLTTDSSPNGKTLTNNNTVGETTGVFGGGATFGISNTNKYLGRSDSFGLSGGAMSMSCWVKLNAEIASGIWSFTSLFTSTNDIGYELNYEYNSGVPRISLQRNRYGAALANAFYNISLGTSNWYHLVYTYDGTSLVGYINNYKFGPVPASGNGNDGSQDKFSIGCRNYGSQDQFGSFSVDDVAVFNKALSNAEVTSLFMRIPAAARNPVV